MMTIHKDDDYDVNHHEDEGIMTVMITIIVASSALPELRMTVMITIIVASSALPRVPNATFEMYRRKR